MPYYTTKTEVEAEFKDITFDSTSNVKDTDVDAFIDENDALIDSYVGVRYTTPVSNSAQGFKLLRAICKALTANKIKGILETVKQGNKEIMQVVRTGLTTPECLKMLEKIASGETTLPGVTPLVTNDSYTRENDVESVFDKDTEQW